MDRAMMIPPVSVRTDAVADIACLAQSPALPSRFHPNISPSSLEPIVGQQLLRPAVLMYLPGIGCTNYIRTVDS